MSLLTHKRFEDKISSYFAKLLFENLENIQGFRKIEFLERIYSDFLKFKNDLIKKKLKIPEIKYSNSREIIQFFKKNLENELFKTNIYFKVKKQFIYFFLEGTVKKFIDEKHDGIIKVLKELFELFQFDLSQNILDILDFKLFLIAEDLEHENKLEDCDLRFLKAMSVFLKDRDFKYFIDSIIFKRTKLKETQLNIKKNSY
jgi:hypothetical protein